MHTHACMDRVARHGCLLCCASKPTSSAAAAAASPELLLGGGAGAGALHRVGDVAGAVWLHNDHRHFHAAWGHLLYLCGDRRSAGAAGGAVGESPHHAAEALAARQAGAAPFACLPLSGRSMLCRVRRRSMRLHSMKRPEKKMTATISGALTAATGRGGALAGRGGKG